MLFWRQISEGIMVTEWNENDKKKNFDIVKMLKTLTM